MRDLSADLRYAFRSLARAPLFTAIAVVSMAFGIASNTAVFTLVDQIVFRKLPVDRPGELVQVHARGTESYGGGMGDGTELSYAMYRELRDGNEVFSGMFCRMPTTLHVGHQGRTERVLGELVSGTFFTELGVDPAAGRLFTPDDERAPGAHPYAVLAFGYWQSRFNGDPGVIGRRITVNGYPLEIAGVVEPRFAGFDVGRPAQVYVPVMMQPQMGPPWLQLDGRRFRWVQVFGRLRPGVALEQAAAGIQPLYRSFLQQEAATEAFAGASGQTRRAFLDGRLTLSDASRGHSEAQDEQNTRPLLILMAIAGAVLLIVCANVANLLIARGAARQRELALRAAVGAGRWQIARLLLVESLLLGAFGAAAGLVMATWGATVLLAFFSHPERPLSVSAGPDARILLFTSAISVLVALLAGLAPALRGARLDAAPVLKSSGGAVVSDQPRLRKTLVVAQVALSFVLLVGAGLFLRSLENLLAIDPGFRTERMLTFSFDLGRGGYEGPRATEFSKTILERISRVPGVSQAAFSFQSLLGGGGWGMGLTIEGYQPPPREDAASLMNAVSPEFFQTLEMRLLAGREFTLRDDRSRAMGEGWPFTVAIVNETFAERYFKGANPIGRRVGIGTNPGTVMPIEIVGLVRDARYQAIREPESPQMFVPILQGDIENVTMYVQSEREPDAIMPLIRREIAALDPQLAVFGAGTLERAVERSLVNERLVASLSSTLSAMATLLAVVGLYGVMAYLVTRRTREIGIRMALGALSSRIAGGVVRETGTLVAAGLLVGGAASWWLGRYVRNQLYGVEPADASTLVAAAAVLSLVACMAAWLPARRAASVSPMTALREE